MRCAALLLPISLALACSCGKGDGAGSGQSGATGEGSSAAAGVVVEVIGKVTARRAGTKEYRTLEVDSPVYAEDTITTGKDSAISIRLHHNDAVLSLAADKSRQLEQTAAWKAPRGASAGLLERPSESGTAAAGRHAEREAADTRATAPTTGEAPTAVVAPPAQPSPAPAPAPAPARRQPRTKKMSKPKPQSLPIDHAKPPPPPPDLQQGLLDSEAPLPDAPSRAAIQAGIKALTGEIQRCKSSFPTRGVVQLTFTIAPSGKVTGTTVKSSPDNDLASCVVAAVKTARFPESKKGTTVTYPFSF